MIVDVHTHVMWYPDHVGERFAQEALASKLVKLQMSGGAAYSASLDLHSYDSTPETHWAASTTADKVVVFGLQAKATGVWVPNEVIADYVAQHPDKLIGWASVDPGEPDAIDRLRHAVDGLGLRGLKLGPAYQHFDPTDRAVWPFFAEVERLGIATIWHQGTTFPSLARLRISTPLWLEDLAMAFPAMRMIVARTLKQSGHGGDIAEASDGAQALVAIKADRPDLVLCDWNMPEMTGIQLLHALRAEGIDVPFGFVTSETTAEMRELAIHGGALFLIAKPFTADDFGTALAAVAA